MSFFSEERASELRELFFESAMELLQTLNDEGLELEKRPGDEEIIRQVRRTVHTLKGDSAACGFQELSELAHQLEDLLTPEVAVGSNGSLADVVLIAADTFSSMLSAYRSHLQPPSGEELRQQILSLTSQPANRKPQRLQGHFAWSEYEQMVIDEALGKGETVINVAFAIDPQCPMRGAAMQLIRNVLQECGRLLAIVPDQSTLAADMDVVEAAIATEHGQDWVQKKCRIPAVIADILVRPALERPQEKSDDVLDLLDDEDGDDAEFFPAVSAEAAVPNSSTGPAAVSAPQRSDTQASSFASATENLLRVDATRIDAVLNLVGELVIGKSMLHQTMTEFDKAFPKNALKGRFADAMAFQARIINDLQKSVMKIRMVPVEQLFRRFPRLVRDVAKSCGREVALVMTGQDTDLDKSILDMLAEPLAHLVRNAIDHGIEAPQDRINAGKPVQGTIELKAYHQGNQIIIEVTDDGRGIDQQKLVRKAVETGIISPADAASLSETQALELIFHQGLSTADHVTSVSGRGVGMDVVRAVLGRLKGAVDIKSEPGKGTTFYLRVPLTLAIIKALLFRVGQRMYAVPLASVLEITRASQSEVHVVDQHHVIHLRNEVLTLVHLHDLAAQPIRPNKMFIVVIAAGEHKFGLVVDSLIGEEELVIKALDDHLVATEMVSGASILGDGTVVLILNIASVISRLARMRKAMGATA